MINVGNQPLSKAFDQPEEVRTFDKGKLEILNVPTGTIGRATFEPGWKWSTCVKPIAGTTLCEAAHEGYVVSGRMHIVMKDGKALDVGPGDLVVVPAGHDAWVVGDEPCVMIDWAGFSEYAKPAKKK